jgi:hypothetical protein
MRPEYRGEQENPPTRKEDLVMEFRPNTIERAYQLAQSGECSTIEEIKAVLRKEGYSASQLASAPTLRRTLRQICAAFPARGSAQRESEKTRAALVQALTP